MAGIIDKYEAFIARQAAQQRAELSDGGMPHEADADAPTATAAVTNEVLAQAAADFEQESGA